MSRVGYNCPARQVLASSCSLRRDSMIGKRSASVDVRRNFSRIRSDETPGASSLLSSGTSIPSSGISCISFISGISGSGTGRDGGVGFSGRGVGCGISSMMILTFSESMLALRSPGCFGCFFRNISTPNMTATDAARKNSGTRIRSQCFLECFGIGAAGGIRESVEVLGGTSATGLVRVSICSGRCGRCLGAGFTGAGSAGTLLTGAEEGWTGAGVCRTTMAGSSAWICV